MATPSLAMVPSGYKDGKLYSVLPNNAGGDFDVTRGSLATRVNKNGLIEPVGTLGADVVLNGGFEEVGADQILNGDFSQEGSELITNGDFATDSDWLFGGSASISNGSANFTGSGDLIRQNATTPSGTYKITFTVTGTGYLVVRNYTGGVLYKEYANISQGEHTIYVEKNEDGIMFQSFGFASSIDNISVVEVGQNWDLNGLASIGDNIVSFVDNGTNPLTGVIQSSVVVANTHYKVSFDVSRYVLGEVEIVLGGVATVSDTLSQGVGTYTFYLKSGGSTNFEIKRWGVIPNFDFDITNITVEEVGQEWTLTDGCSITAQGARITSDGTYQAITQNNALVIGGTYEMEYEITESVSGSLSMTESFGIDLKDTVGLHKFYAVAANTYLQIKRYGGVTDITIDNIKVKRLNGDDTPRIDYTDGGCPVLLTEPQSTNLITNSSDVVAINGGVVELSSGTSPDGTQNAFKVTFGVDQNDGASIYIGGSSALPSTEYTFSVYAKSVNGDGQFKVRIDTNTQGLVADNDITSTSEWQRYSFTFTTDAACSSFSSNTRLKSVTANNEILFYGLQLEELSYATSYIPTYGAVRTRLQDSVKNTNATSYIGQTQGTIFLDYNSTTPDGELLSVNRSTTNSIHISTSSSGALRAQLYSDGAIRSHILTTDLESRGKVAISYENNSQKIYFNGALTQSYTDSWTPNVAMTQISMNEGGYVSLRCKTNVSALQVFNTALSDAELIILTTI